MFLSWRSFLVCSPKSIASQPKLHYPFEKLFLLLRDKDLSCALRPILPWWTNSPLFSLGSATSLLLICSLSSSSLLEKSVDVHREESSWNPRLFPSLWHHQIRVPSYLHYKAQSFLLLLLTDLETLSLSLAKLGLAAAAYKEKKHSFLFVLFPSNDLLPHVQETKTKPTLATHVIITSSSYHVFFICKLVLAFSLSLCWSHNHNSTNLHLGLRSMLL